MSIKIVVLASGRGSNFEAIYAACQENQIDGEVVALFSDKEEAVALKTAEKYGLKHKAVIAKNYTDKMMYEKALVEELNQLDYDLIVLAGYMKVLGEHFLTSVKVPIMNIHPSLLPSFPGLHAQRQALEYGVKYTGCTVHFVDSGLDSGPIILQRVVGVENNDTEESLSLRILKEEHRLYSEAISLFAQNRLMIRGRTVEIMAEGAHCEKSIN